MYTSSLGYYSVCVSGACRSARITLDDDPSSGDVWFSDRSATKEMNAHTSFGYEYVWVSSGGCSSFDQDYGYVQI